MLLFSSGHGPGFMNILLAEACQYWDISAHKDYLRILIFSLFHKMVYPSSIDFGGSRLHLCWWIMNPRLVIRKDSCQMRRDSFPIQPKIVCGEAHQHTSHSKVDPSCLDQASHASVQRGKSSCRSSPGWIVVFVPVPQLTMQWLIRRMQVVLLNQRISFKLLNKVHTPMNSCLEGSQRSAKGGCVT